MSNRGVLPAELESFLASKGVRSLLIRGPSGTGRTLLARAILEAFRVDQRLLVTGEFRSTIPDPTAGERRPEIRVVSYSEFMGTADRRAFLQFSKDVGTSLSRPMPTADTSDLRPSLPGKGSPRSRAAAIVVIDGWRTFFEQFQHAATAGGADTAPSEVQERALLSLLTFRSARVVLIAGVGESGAVEHSVDGIVDTNQEIVDERLERWLQIVKTRGTEVSGRFHPFTLHGGRFRSFPPYPAQPTLVGSRAEVDPMPGPVQMWPGSTDFAHAFGRLTTGSTTLIETDPRVPYQIPFALAIPALVATVRALGRVVVVPPPVVTPGQMRRIVTDPMTQDQSAGAKEILEDQVRILSHFGNAAQDPELSRAFLPLRPEAGGMSMGAVFTRDVAGVGGTLPPESPLPRFPHLHAFLQGGPEDIANAMVISVDGVTAAAQEIGSGFTPDSFMAVARRDLSGHPMHIIFLSREGEPLVKPLEPLVGVHLRLRSKHGRYFLHGIRPWTPNFIVQVSEETGPHDPPYHLVMVS